MRMELHISIIAPGAIDFNMMRPYICWRGNIMIFKLYGTFREHSASTLVLVLS